MLINMHIQAWKKFIELQKGQQSARVIQLASLPIALCIFSFYFPIELLKIRIPHICIFLILIICCGQNTFQTFTFILVTKFLILQSMGIGFFLSVHDIINSIFSFCSEENYLHFLYVHAINVRNPWNNSLLFPAPSQKSSHFSWSVQPRSGHITPVAVEPVIHGDLPWLPRFYTFILRIFIYKTQDSVLAATTSTNHVNDLHTHICSFILHGVVPSSLNCLSFFRFKFFFFLH